VAWISFGNKKAAHPIWLAQSREPEQIFFGAAKKVATLSRAHRLIPDKKENFTRLIYFFTAYFRLWGLRENLARTAQRVKSKQVLEDASWNGAFLTVVR
jgi:hypothetical protein